MTLPRIAQTDRLLANAARQVASGEAAQLWSGAPVPAQIVESVEEHLGWDLDEREQAVVLAAYADAKRTTCAHCDGVGAMAGAHTESVVACPYCDGAGVSA